MRKKEEKKKKRPAHICGYARLPSLICAACTAPATLLGKMSNCLLTQLADRPITGRQLDEAAAQSEHRDSSDCESGEQGRWSQTGCRTSTSCWSTGTVATTEPQRHR